MSLSSLPPFPLPPSPSHFETIFALAMLLSVISSNREKEKGDERQELMEGGDEVVHVARVCSE